MDSIETREAGIADGHVGGLQPRIVLLTMDDELAADHANVRIGLLAMRDISIGEIRCVGWRMEGIRRGMNTDEAEAVVDGVEKSLLALRSHGRILVGAFLGEIAGRKKDHSGVLVKFLRIKDPSVFRSGEIEMVLRCETTDGRLGNAGLAVRHFDDGVFETRGFREQQDGLVFRGTGRMRKQKPSASGSRGAKKIASSRK